MTRDRVYSLWVMNIQRLRRVLKQVKSEGGQVLILVMLLLLIGGLLLPPLLALSITGLQTGQMYGSKAEETYSADSGLAHGLWQIKYDNLASAFTSPSYDTFDFGLAEVLRVNEVFAL